MAGHIGRKVIQIAQALEMNILVYTRTPREDEKGIRYVSLMKPSAFIINTSRGALIDEAGLVRNQKVFEEAYDMGYSI